MVRSQHDSKSSTSKELNIGEAFEIDYFYETLASLKADLTFKSGRQEDAQEFLSFLLNRLHEEMVRCLESLNPSAVESSHTNGQVQGQQELNTAAADDDQDDWKEVGKKNRAFVTRKVCFQSRDLIKILYY